MFNSIKTFFINLFFSKNDYKSEIIEKNSEIEKLKKEIINKDKEISNYIEEIYKLKSYIKDLNVEDDFVEWEKY